MSTPRKSPTGPNLQQLDEVSWSLGSRRGRSRKAKKVARSERTELGGINLDTKALEVSKRNLLLTRNNLWRS